MLWCLDTACARPPPLLLPQLTAPHVLPPPHPRTPTPPPSPTKIKKNEKLFEETHEEKEALRVKERETRRKLAAVKSREKRGEKEERRVDALLIKATKRADELETESAKVERGWQRREAAWQEESERKMVKMQRTCDGLRETVRDAEGRLEISDAANEQLADERDRLLEVIERERRQAADAAARLSESLDVAREETAREHARKQAGDDQLLLLEQTIRNQQKKIVAFEDLLQIKQAEKDELVRRFSALQVSHEQALVMSREKEKRLQEVKETRDVNQRLWRLQVGKGG